MCVISWQSKFIRPISVSEGGSQYFGILLQLDQWGVRAKNIYCKSVKYFSMNWAWITLILFIGKTYTNLYYKLLYNITDVAMVECQSTIAICC